jgi:hypothetical protein
MQVLQRPWTRHFFRRKESLRTTWKFRVAALGFLVLLAFLTRGIWIPGIGRSLVCDAQTGSADAILIDNLDPTYALFLRAARGYVRSEPGPRVLVPVDAVGDFGESNTISRGIADLMASAAGLSSWEPIPVRIREPVSLNAASQIGEFLSKEHISAVMLVTPAFRSRRSFLVYQAVLSQRHIALFCDPVAERTPEAWADTWHGIEEVAQQFIKLQYYRFWVLPIQSQRWSAQSLPSATTAPAYPTAG